MEDLFTFIKNYSQSDVNRIMFSANGKEGKDLNYHFRDQICKSVFKEGVKAPDLLIKDLFRAEAIYCREILGSSQNLAALGALLLTQSLSKYIEDYLIGKHESFDTQCAVSLGYVGADVLKEVLNELKNSDVEFSEADFTKQEAVEFIQNYYDRTFK
ncbi:hypothetical protein [Aliiglaciecola lipolytica]|uniref:Uncharacterized protein n=1 Tax=Aliiglaciecola lipolytica E3 TaxID=1127673 RepID=K6Y3Q2_9ALTE|nr:hypothetical protein [Aliiglaciecola lipolytica]GAC12892.1 hypothetical protein GLIP_0238 [Aliiglaciecola lipolytica E3]